jgi:SpoVK/Ycf46/Vps4 family AAA+-type ATPase
VSTANHTKSKKAYLVSLKHKLKKHLQLQSDSVTRVDRRWLNGFMAAGFHSGLISLSELKLEYMKAHRNAYSERMSEAQEQQLERRLTKLCQME